MSRFFSEKYKDLTPYTPGEQPKERRYIKLNTNESPFPPSPYAQILARQAAGSVELYSDPECRQLVNVTSEKLGVSPDSLIFTNGSDDILNFAFMAFCDKDHPAAFSDITYGFYPVFAKLNGVPYEEIPLNEDFTLPVDKFSAAKGTLFIANPNAPTGLYLPLRDIEKIVSGNRDRIVVVDEAYIDFGGESAAHLTEKYDNLLVTQTFSKSRSLAGARLGFGIACPSLIKDLQTIRYSTNPYNINSMTMAAGIGAMSDTEYFRENCRKIIDTRGRLTKELRDMGFVIPESKANFVFAKYPGIDGETVYNKLRERGILVRHFNKPRLRDYNRITVGNDEQTDILIETLKDIVSEEKQ